jgi:hypothetical protein
VTIDRLLTISESEFPKMALIRKTKFKPVLNLLRRAGGWKRDGRG